MVVSDVVLVPAEILTALVVIVVVVFAAAVIAVSNYDLISVSDMSFTNSNPTFLKLIGITLLTEDVLVSFSILIDVKLWRKRF